VEAVEAADTFLEREVAVDNDAVDVFCRFRGGAIEGTKRIFLLGFIYVLLLVLVDCELFGK